MNKKLIIIVSLALALFVLAFFPTIQGLFKEDIPSSPYADFGTFIPYTMGYFPENFTILAAGTDAIHKENYDKFIEWYTSNQYFIRLIQVEGDGRPLWDQGYAASQSLIIQDQYAEIKLLKELDNWLGDEFNPTDYDTEETRVISFFINEIRLQVLSNLPENELITIAENLVPSICLNPTQDSP